MKPGEASKFWGHLNNTGRFDFRILSRKPVLEAGSGFERLVFPPSSVTVSRERKVRPDVLADLFHLPFKNRAFGLVVAHEVFCTYSAEEQERLWKELARISDAIYARQWKGCGWNGCGFKFGASPPFRSKEA